MVHPVSRWLSTRWLRAEPNEQPLGVVRRPRHEDLCVFYRASDGSLVLRALPERFQSTVVLIPLRGDSTIRQAKLDGKVGRIEFSALEAGSYLVASFPLVDSDELQRQALELRKRGSYSEALSLFEEVLAVDPEDFIAWTRKGFVLRDMGSPDEAMAAVQEALKINPSCALSWRAKGALLRDAGKHQEGLNCYLRSLELDATDHLCWQNKHNALEALGRHAESQEDYETAERVKELYPEEKH